jgi:hypothetical protein
MSERKCSIEKGKDLGLGFLVSEAIEGLDFEGARFGLGGGSSGRVRTSNREL